MNTPIQTKIWQIEKDIKDKIGKDYEIHSEDLRAMIRTYCIEKGYYNQNK